MTFLALFMLLLAFFILLNGVATREAARTEALMQSLGATFGARSKTPPSVDPLAAARDAFRVELGTLLARVLPEAAAKSDRRNGAIVAAVPVARLFREGGVDFHSRSGELLAGFAALLAEPASTHRVEVEALFGAGPAAPAVDGLEVRRAGALVRELDRLGAPSGAVAVGLSPRDAGTVEFAFRLRPAEGARP